MMSKQILNLSEAFVALLVVIVVGLCILDAVIYFYWVARQCKDKQWIHEYFVRATVLDYFGPGKTFS